MNNTSVGLIGMCEVALRLSRKGELITVHGGSCAFDLSDSEGNRYEIKTARASMKNDKEHAEYRGWVFGSGSKNRNIAKFEYTAYVLLSEQGDLERILLIPQEEDKFINGRSAIMKDTKWQLKNSPRKDMVEYKWYDKYELN